MKFCIEQTKSQAHAVKWTLKSLYKHRVLWKWKAIPVTKNVVTHLWGLSRAAGICTSWVIKHKLTAHVSHPSHNNKISVTRRDGAVSLGFVLTKFPVTISAIWLLASLTLLSIEIGLYDSHKTHIQKLNGVIMSEWKAPPGKPPHCLTEITPCLFVQSKIIGLLSEDRGWNRGPTSPANEAFRLPTLHA